jgi:hypothetical protein
MKVINPFKTPFGRGKFSPVKDARYRQWDDAFEVEFADGLSFLEPHKTIRKANRISLKSTVVRVELSGITSKPATASGMLGVIVV